MRPTRAWFSGLLCFLTAFAALGQPAAPPAPTAHPRSAAAAHPQAATNPLLADWKTPFGVPPFDAIRDEHFLPAFEAAIARHTAQIEAIASNEAPPDFANTVEALADSGELLARVEAVFSNLSSADTNPLRQGLRKAIAPMIAAHEDDVALDPRVFARVREIYSDRAALKLTPEQARLLEETYTDFVRSGALLSAEQKGRMREINAELSVLGVTFGDNLLAETNAFRLVIDDEADLAGLPPGLVAAAAAAARSAKLDGKWVFTLQAPSIWPFLQTADNRDLRRQILSAYLSRCDRGGDLDNNAVIARVAALRAEKARLLGYGSWADFVLEKRMAKTPAGVRSLLDQVWPRALATAKSERDAMQAMIDAEAGGFKLAPWDWRYYAERVKKARFDLDDASLRPYFPLERVRDGAFSVATRLYGLSFTARPDLPTYHPDVQAFEVKERDGSPVGVLYLDYHPRPGKRAGAWSSTYRKEWIDGGTRVAPIVVNVANFSRPAGDAPALLSLEEVDTLFHEFGHALHQLLSQCRYRSLSGSAVARDFVELPSQIMENWAGSPEVMKQYARHWKTGEAIPDETLAKIQRARTFNQGFATTEYLAASLLDLDWHTLTTTEIQDTRSFEARAIERMGLIPEIPPRYRSVYFNHVIGGYAAGYYSYMWSEVLDADAFQAFVENGLFDPATAKSFRDNILARGGSEDPAVLYQRFRGRAPSVEPLLRRRGLV